MVIAAIVGAWQWIESRPIDPVTLTVPSTSTSSTTTVPTTTTLTAEEKSILICLRSAVYGNDVLAVSEDAGAGPLVFLGLSFWQEILELSSGGLRAEALAVIGYYEDFIEIGSEFDYDYERIIVEGDKEKLELLLTRPAPGLTSASAVIEFGCAIEVPDKPSMTARTFERLEERLLD